ncbi:MAG: hypothetical protein JNK48_03355 [Bryobacterales bacterium]|nr:hypothetical protein [Bryobacterales bacterium]
MDPELIQSIPGATALLTANGEWPNFADYEVVEVMLIRRGKSWLTITNDCIDEECDWKPIPESSIRFEFSSVLGLDLLGYHEQNVIGGLEITAVENRFKIKIDYCTGICGELEVADLRVVVVDDSDADARH